MTPFRRQTALKVFLLVFALFSKSSMCKKKKNFPSVSILVMHQKQMKPFVFQNSERTGADWIVVPCYFFQLRPVHHDLLSEFVHCLLWKFSCLFLLCFQKVACVKRKKKLSLCSHSCHASETSETFCFSKQWKYWSRLNSCSLLLVPITVLLY